MIVSCRVVYIVILLYQHPILFNDFTFWELILIAIISKHSLYFLFNVWIDGYHRIDLGVMQLLEYYIKQNYPSFYSYYFMVLNWKWKTSKGPYSSNNLNCTSKNVKNDLARLIDLEKSVDFVTEMTRKMFRRTLSSKNMLGDSWTQELIPFRRLYYSKRRWPFFLTRRHIRLLYFSVLPLKWGKKFGSGNLQNFEFKPMLVHFVLIYKENIGYCY